MRGKKSKQVANDDDEVAIREETSRGATIRSIMSPRLAWRVVTVVKIVAPVVTPYLLAASTSARGFLNQQRANRLGVHVADVGAFRGPTGRTGARISGLLSSIDELNSRKGTDLAIARFVESAHIRLADLTTAVQASASMPQGERRSVLRAVNRELDQISADLMTHLIGAPLA
jgi:hypothetical protein